jgi:hypothetical protein
LRSAVLDGAEAIKTLGDFKRRSYDLWMTAARGVAPLCELADRPGTSRKARKNLLEDNGYGSLNESTVSRLLLMAKYETDIRKWRDSLTQNKRDAWNSPTSICNRCPALRKAIAEANKNKPPRQPRKTDKSAALESLLDKLLDLIGAVEDIDNRRALVERVTSSVAKLLPEAEPTKPSRKKRGKTKAPVEVKREVAPGHTKTAEQALAEHRAKTMKVVVPGLGTLLEIPATPTPEEPKKKKGKGAKVVTQDVGLGIKMTIPVETED